MPYFRTTFAALLIALSAGVTATAQTETETETEQTGWMPVNLSMVWTGSAVDEDIRNEPMGVEAIYSGPDTEAGNVAFTCTNGRLSAAVALRPVDLQAMLVDPPESRDVKSRRLTFTIDGEAIPGRESNFLHLRRADVFRTQRRAQTVALYNAVIRGSTVTLKDRKDEAALNLPPVDDTFRDFGGACGVGRNAPD